MRSPRIACVIGTRPEIIKFRPLLLEFDRNHLEYFVAYSGQHYSAFMKDIFFREFKINNIRDLGRKGNLLSREKAVSDSHSLLTAVMMVNLERLFSKERPDIVLVLGDTDTTLAGALVAAKRNIIVGHIEAGLRCYDRTMAEEVNRVLVDHLSTLLFAPSQFAVENLVKEGISREAVILTGNTIVDSVKLSISKISSSKITDVLGLQPKKFILLTMHRAENVDDEVKLVHTLSALSKLGLPVIFPVHPRTKNRLKGKHQVAALRKISNLTMIDPLGYLDFLKLLSDSRLVITDSGGVQEEAITLHVPCVTSRPNTERSETVVAGGNVIVQSENLLKVVQRILSNPPLELKMKLALNPYGNGDASVKIVEALLAYWGGI
jgi:UDP-N-acetylglucosamine 2-epimerase (non-hydrolysing)